MPRTPACCDWAPTRSTTSRPRSSSGSPAPAPTSPRPPHRRHRPLAGVRGLPRGRIIDVDVDQPVIADGYVDTFRQSVSDDDNQFATTRDRRGLVARLHHLTAPKALHLPELDPFTNAAQRIDGSLWLSPADRAFLTETLARLQEEYRRGSRRACSGTR